MMAAAGPPPIVHARATSLDQAGVNIAALPLSTPQELEAPSNDAEVEERV